MRIRDFIRDQFKKRLDAAGCLVVYAGVRRSGKHPGFERRHAVRDRQAG
jgi:hypothetical protein